MIDSMLYQKTRASKRRPYRVNVEFFDPSFNRYFQLDDLDGPVLQRYFRRDDMLARLIQLK